MWSGKQVSRYSFMDTDVKWYDALQLRVSMGFDHISNDACACIRPQEPCKSINRHKQHSLAGQRAGLKSTMDTIA